MIKKTSLLTRLPLKICTLLYIKKISLNRALLRPENSSSKRDSRPIISVTSKDLTHRRTSVFNAIRMDDQKNNNEDQFFLSVMYVLHIKKINKYQR